MAASSRHIEVLLPVTPAAPVVTGSASLSATGAIASSGTVIAVTVISRAAALSASGTIASAGSISRLVSRSAAISASGSVTSAGEVRRLRTASMDFAASAVIDSSSLRILVRSSALNAAGALAAGFSITRVLARAGSFSAVGVFSSSGNRRIDYSKPRRPIAVVASLTTTSRATLQTSATVSLEIVAAATGSGGTSGSAQDLGVTYDTGDDERTATIDRLLSEGQMID
jgi:hypothetical protein